MSKEKKKTFMIYRREKILNYQWWPVRISHFSLAPSWQTDSRAQCLVFWVVLCVWGVKYVDMNQKLFSQTKQHNVFLKPPSEAFAHLPYRWISYTLHMSKIVTARQTIRINVAVKAVEVLGPRKMVSISLPQWSWNRFEILLLYGY